MMSNEKKRSLTQKELRAALNELKATSTIKDLLISATETLGVSHSLYIHYPAIGAFDFKNTGIFHHYQVPEEILNFYNPSGKFDGDPLIVLALAQGRSFWLSDSYDNPYLKKVQHEKIIHCALGLVVDGLCCPLYGPDGRTGFAFFSFGRGKAEFDPIMQIQIECFAQAMHVQYCMLIKGLQKEVDLTARESEVIELISYGKTNPEIAQILEISPRTVAVHASKIFVKLGVGDRVSAAMRAQTLNVKI